MNFKKLLREDLGTFINLGEYGETVEIDGVKLAAVVTFSTGESSTEYSNKHGINPKRHAVNLIGANLIISCRSKDLPRVPKNSEYLYFNGRKYRVVESSEIEGITRLICAADQMQLPKSKLPGLYESGD